MISNTVTSKYPIDRHLDTTFEINPGVNKVQVYEGGGGGWKIISDFLCFWEDNYKNHINGVYC